MAALTVTSTRPRHGAAHAPSATPLRSLRPAPGRTHPLRAFSTHFLPWRLARHPLSDPNYDAAFTRRDYGNLRIVHSECDPLRAQRTPAEIAATTGEWIAASYTHRGFTRFDQGTPVELWGGSLYLWDSTRPAEFQINERASKTTMFFPRAEILQRRPEIRDALGTALVPDRGVVQAWLGSASELTAAARNPDSLESVRTVLIEMLALSVQSSRTPDTEDDATVVFERIRRYIHRHLTDPGLCPRSVARAHDMSLRSLQMLFSKNGETVATYIRTQRVHSARNDLLAHPKLPVTEVALRWGFCDPSHFSRVFKSTYGLSPAQIRERQRPRPRADLAS